MIIKKRKTLEDTLKETFSPHWRNVFMVPALSQLERWCEQDTSAGHILTTAQKLNSGMGFTTVSLTDKIFMYALSVVMFRCFGSSVLTSDAQSRLLKNLQGPTNLELIETGAQKTGHLCYRQVFLWDIPALLERFPKRGTMPLPMPIVVEAPKPTRPKLRRLPLKR